MLKSTQNSLNSETLDTQNPQNLLLDKFLPTMASEMKLTLLDISMTRFQRNQKATSLNPLTTTRKFCATQPDSTLECLKMSIAVLSSLSIWVTIAFQSMSQLRKTLASLKVLSYDATSTRMLTTATLSSHQLISQLEATLRSMASLITS